MPWVYVISDINGEEIVWTFYKEELQITNQEEFRVEKAIKRIGDKLYVKLKGYNSFNSCINKKKVSSYKMIFLKPYIRSKTKIKVALDLSNYATKSDLKNAIHRNVLKRLI